MRQCRALLLALALGACARQAPAPESPLPGEQFQEVEQLEFSATVERDQFDVFGAVEIMNTGADTARVSYLGYCELAILFYDPAGRPVSLRWDSSRWWIGQQAPCPNTPVRLDIPPQTLARLVAPAVGAGGVLSDSLPAGPYIPAMRLRLLHPRDTTLVLPADLVDLN